jgi:uncharacterized membrane protein
VETDLLQHLKARPALLICVLLGVVLFLAVPFKNDHAARWLLAWDISAGAYLAIAGYKMARATEETMARRAEKVDAGRYGFLILSVIAALVGLAAIVIELSKIKQGGDNHILFYICVSVATIVISWAFIQIIFTEHYAHEYYIRRDYATLDDKTEAGGLKFVGTTHPDFLDFLYFTVTIGVANQTADIAVSSREMRILVLLHAVISYFFNTAILALSFNILSNVVL